MNHRSEKHLKIKPISLNIISGNKKRKSYIYIIFLVVFAIGCIYSAKFGSDTFSILLIIIPFIFTFLYLGIESNTKHFIVTNDCVIIQNDRIQKKIDNRISELENEKIDKIYLLYSGFDNGPFFHPIFNKYNKRGNNNHIVIKYKDGCKDVYEVYIDSEKDAELLKYIMHNHELKNEIINI